jgi:predicted dehydrogenase
VLPNSLHGRWTRAALAAGKQVLCEKPFTANAADAREIAELAATSDRIVMEAIQYRDHPLTLCVEQIIASGELGNLQRVDVALCVLLPKSSNGNVYDYSLAGGALMDAGSYVVHMLGTFGGSTPEVVSARAKLSGPEVDRAVTAELRFASGHAGRVHCSMLVDRCTALHRQGGWRPWRVAAQSADTFPAVLGPISRQQARRALLGAQLL